MTWCPRCNAREFIENTEDGPEAICMSGHRRSLSASPPVPDIGVRADGKAKVIRRANTQGVRL